MPRDESLDPARLSNALVRWFAELTYQGMFATDRDLRVIVWNRWMEVHSGRSAEETVGRLLTELYPDVTVRGVDQYYRDALAGRISMISYGLHKYVLSLPATNRDLGLHQMPQSGRIGPLSDGDSVIGTVTTLEDISDRLASEGELRKQIDVQKMARVTAEKAVRAKDEFLSTVSHEIRNPLNAVLGWTRILIDRVDVEPEMLARALRVIDRNATAQARMIDDLLDVARIASGKLRLEMQPVDLLAVTLAAVDVIGPSAKVKQIEIRTRLDPEDLTRPWRSAPAPAGGLEPPLERREVHRRRRGGGGAGVAGGTADPAGGRRYRPRHQPGIPSLRVRAVPPERCVQHQAVWRTGTGSGAGSRAGRAPWRDGARGQRGRTSRRDIYGRSADGGVARRESQPRHRAARRRLQARRRRSPVFASSSSRTRKTPGNCSPRRWRLVAPASRWRRRATMRWPCCSNRRRRISRT